MRLIHYTYPSFRSVAPGTGGFQRSPWSGLESDIDRLFETALSDFGGTPSPTRFPVDVYEDKDNTYVRAELPGVSRDDISVEMVEGYLTITAARKTPASRSTKSGQARSASSGQDDGDGAESFSFSRSVNIADEIDAEKVSATYENGIVTVTLPKREEAKPRKITVAVK